MTTGLLFGVGPAVRATGGIDASALKTGAGLGHGHRSLLSRGLLVGQALMCTALLIVASVFVRTVQNLRGQEAGYREDHLLVAEIGFPRTYAEAHRDQLIEEFRARVAALPGVEVGIAITAVASVAIAAAYLPARSAARTDPLVVLREE